MNGLRTHGPTALGATLLVLLLTVGCSVYGRDQASVLDVSVHSEVQVDGLRIAVDRVVVEPRHVLVDVTLTNTGEDTYALLLGGCGPSQGTVWSAAGWKEVYYAYRSETDLSRSLAPGERVRGTIALAVKTGEPLDPRAVTRLDLHPGYVFNRSTGSLTLVEASVSLEGTGGG